MAANVQCPTTPDRRVGEKSLWGGAVFPGTLPPDQYSQGSNLMGGGRDLRPASSTIIVLFCFFSFPQKNKNGRGKNPIYTKQ